MSDILIVTTDSDLTTIVRNGLQAGGFEGRFARNIDEGWRSLVLEPATACVVDARQHLHWEFVNRVRNDGRFHRLPLVVLAGPGDQVIHAKADGLGVEFLSTPFIATALVEKIRRAMRGAGPTLGGKIQLDRIEVVVLLDRYRVRGYIYLPPEVSRFSDGIEAVMRDNRAFLPLTNVSITTADVTQQLIGHADLLQVRKDHIRLISPIAPGVTVRDDEIETQAVIRVPN